MRSADVIILGGGIIGLSLAFELRKSRAEVLVLERREPGLEASHAAAGMLAPGEMPEPMMALAAASAGLYPEFVREIEEASGLKADLRSQGTIWFPGPGEAADGRSKNCRKLSEAEQKQLEPGLEPRAGGLLLAEQSVDPRRVTAACLAAAKACGVNVAGGEPVRSVRTVPGRAQPRRLEVTTTKTRYSAAAVVNCCGAWAGEIAPLALPTRPVKGQMLSLLGQQRELVQHVIRAEEVYIVPRGDGRILVGSTVEEAGFNKQVEPATIQRLRAAAEKLVPALAEARLHETWAGLRPGTPDDLPLLGATSLPGYFVAGGHFRNGILLAPITARVMAQMVRGERPQLGLDVFSPARFSPQFKRATG